MEIIKFNFSQFTDKETESFHLARTTLTSRTDLRLHNHDFYEIFWILEGEGIHYINKTEQKITKGTICFIRPDDSHTFAPVSASGGLTITNIAFQQDTFDHLSQRYPELIKKYFLSTQLPEVINLPVQQLQQLSQLTDQVLSKEKNNLVLDNFWTNIFLLVDKSKTKDSSAPYWLNYAVEKFQTPGQLKKGAQGFVALTGKNKDYVNRTVRKFYNLTTTDFTNKLKLNYAARQLSMTNESIKSVAYNCGYMNLGHFYKTFKKYYGSTPSEYREEYKKIF